MPIVFERVTDKAQIVSLCEMARRIWTEHYTPIIGEAQVEYMLEKFQSVDAVSEQLASGGYEYYFALYHGEYAGFIGIVPEQEKLFLSNLYIDADFRHRGIAREAMNFLSEYGKQRNLNKIYLTVNRNNTDSIAAYRSMGFDVVCEQVADIGGGFVMDDYVLERPV